MKKKQYIIQINIKLFILIQLNKNIYQSLY